MGTHHLILGKTTDYLTGQTVTDTHDERARQEIAKFLVAEKGYEKSEIRSRLQLSLALDGRTGAVPVDFLLKPADKSLMIILFRPGSLVSRRRIALAAARLTEDRIIPYAAVTNAEDAEILETSTGKVVSSGLQGIFARHEAIELLGGMDFPVLTAPRREKEERILYAMEVLSQKECDDYTCGRF